MAIPFVISFQTLTSPFADMLLPGLMKFVGVVCHHSDASLDTFSSFSSTLLSWLEMPSEHENAASAAETIDLIWRNTDKKVAVATDNNTR